MTKGRVPIIKMQIECVFFSMEGGGLEFHIPILKNDFLENHLESFPDCENVLHLVWALYYVYIVVEVTLNMAK